MKRILILAKKGDEKANKVKDELVVWLSKRSVGVVDVSGSQEELGAGRIKDVTLGIAVGGDGTLLTLVRRLLKKDQFPLMGVNLGTLGFITEVNREEMFDVLSDVLRGAYREESRCLFDVELWRKKKCVESGTVFNDAVITKDARTSMLKIDVSLDSQALSSVRADGYIISTPTGSTGYNLSAAGPIVHPALSALSLVPIGSHSVIHQAIIVPATSRLSMKIHDFSGGAYLVFDGQVMFELKTDDEIRVRVSKSSLRLIRSPHSHWAQVLHTKLGLR